MKKLLRLYVEGWCVIVRSAAFLLMLWIALLPLWLLDWLAKKSQHDWSEIIGYIAIFLYVPFAVRYAYLAFQGLNQTGENFVPLLQRQRKKKSETG